MERRKNLTFHARETESEDLYVADEKKPKIDLKARLNRATGGGQVPPPSSSAAGIVPPPSMTGSGVNSGVPIPPPISSPPGLPVGPPPPFGGVQHPTIDPSNPLAAVAVPYRSRPPSMAPPAPRPQRIEMDEGTVIEARRGGMKQGLIVGGVAALVAIGIGWVAGGASARGEARDAGKQAGKDLSKEVTAAREQMKTLADKLDEGRTQLASHKFPADLAHDLGGINIDFSGQNLAGRRFSGMSPTTVSDLTSFIVDVTALNERRTAMINLLGTLQKPLTDQFSAPAGQATISQVIVVSSDQNGPQALLASLSTPISVNAQNLNLPDNFTFADPRGTGANSSLARYKSGDISAKPAALPVVPKTFERLCPSAASGQAAQLAAQLGTSIKDIRGEAGQSSDQLVQDSKPGLLDRADKLAQALNKSAE